MRGSDPVTTFMELIAESQAMEQETGHGADMIIGTSMQEEDIKALMNWPHSNICSDGSLNDMHPRGTQALFHACSGAMYANMELMSLEDAVHKMTGLSAQHMGFKKRGVIRPGASRRPGAVQPGDDHRQRDATREPARLSYGYQQGLGQWLAGVRRGFRNRLATGPLYQSAARLMQTAVVNSAFIRYLGWFIRPAVFGQHGSPVLQQVQFLK